MSRGRILKPARAGLAVALTLALLLAAALFGGGGGARAEESTFVPPMPRDFALVDVYLVTIGRGPQVWALFGHTILRVIDRGAGMDLNFNWGIFDFNDPAFAWKFYLGDLNYMMIITDFWGLVDGYRNVEHRAVTQDHLLLTKAQKEALMRRLIDNARPEHVHYQYSQFRDNCSTKVRDHLDAALGGQLRAAYEHRPARATLRDQIRRTADAAWWVYLGLDTLSNDRLDQPTTSWDEMFLPEALRARLAELPAYDDAGHPVPGRSLLEGVERIVDLPEPAPGRDPYMLAALFGGLPLVLGALALGGRLSERRTAVTLGLMSLGFGLWSGLWGTVMTANWVVSHYVELKHNAALWLTWPVDWVFAAYGVRLLLRRARPPRLARLARIVLFVASAHVTGILALTLLWATGVVTQSVLPVLASTGLIGLIYYGTTIRHAAAREP